MAHCTVHTNSCDLVGWTIWVIAVWCSQSIGIGKEVVTMHHLSSAPGFTWSFKTQANQNLLQCCIYMTMRRLSLSLQSPKQLGYQCASYDIWFTYKCQKCVKVSYKIGKRWYIDLVLQFNASVTHKTDWNWRMRPRLTAHSGVENL